MRFLPFRIKVLKALPPVTAASVQTALTDALDIINCDLRDLRIKLEIVAKQTEATRKKVYRDEVADITLGIAQPKGGDHAMPDNPAGPGGGAGAGARPPYLWRTGDPAE